MGYIKKWVTLYLKWNTKGEVLKIFKNEVSEDRCSHGKKKKKKKKKAP